MNSLQKCRRTERETEEQKMKINEENGNWKVKERRNKVGKSGEDEVPSMYMKEN